MEGRASADSPSSIFSHKNYRFPEDTVFYSIFPDFAVSSTVTDTAAGEVSSELQSLHLQILHALYPCTADYIWQHEPFTLSLSSPAASPAQHQIPHLHGKVRYGDNLDDEWFVVFLLFEISRRFPQLSVRVWDTDGEFLLVEAAFHIPRWLNPDSSTNRVFIRGGELHIIDRNQFSSTPTLYESLRYLATSGGKARASESVQLAINNRIRDYPEKARRNMHRVRVRVPASVAQVLKHEPCLISLAVEGFYDRDIDSMKFAAKMERFLSNGNGEELVQISATMSRAMYAQLMQQTFQAPKCYPMPPRGDPTVYVEADLGMKIACGFEMMYQMRRQEGLEGKGSTWETFRESLESSGYFEGLLPGSKEYRRLMENAEAYYRNSYLFSRASEMMSAPIKRIDEILALPYSADDFGGQELPPSDDDSWLYSGEDELNAALLERQKEMELYNLEHGEKRKTKDAGASSYSNLNDSGLGDIAKSMEAFVQKISSYEGVEVPENRNLKDVDLDVGRFTKDVESVMRLPDSEETGSDVDDEEGSSSDLDFGEPEDGIDIADHAEDTFMHSYSAALDDELKTTSLHKSFTRAKEQPMKNDEGTSNGSRDMDEDFTPVDVDVNLVKSFLDSFSSQQGLPGPATNILGLMGLQLPRDVNKGK